MEPLTNVQLTRLERKATEKEKLALELLKEVLGSKERKDMLENIELEIAERLYLTRNGLVAVRRKPAGPRFERSDPEHEEVKEKASPSLKLIQEFGVTIQKLQTVSKKLKT